MTLLCAEWAEMIGAGQAVFIADGVGQAIGNRLRSGRDESPATPYSGK
jgi:hypothetical protein